jgi:hypothetical protein
MPVSGGSQGMDPASLCCELVGLSEARASERIKDCGFRFRVAAVGDTSMALTADRKPDRVNLWLSSHRVVVRAEAF